jgi:2-oxoglutarate dehydrogenase E1 component
MQVDPAAEVKQVQEEFLADQKTASLASKKPRLAQMPSYWDPYKGGPLLAKYDVPTGIAPDRIADLCQRMTRAPEGFHIHPKVRKLYDQRVQMGAGKVPFDYGAAELLAFSSLLMDGTPVRLSGQDSRRGTFSQRHAVLVDIENEQRYFPLQHLGAKQARFEVYNSMLSEAAVLGFEYGYSRDSPETLVLWEAQFGDFANGAQIMIDQFIAAGEAKWNLLSGLVMLLPHGYEGQGPEHSSARVERYLQLAAGENIQICQPSTAAQYFHLLRRQAMRRWRKPLVVFTPKSMLRNADAASPIADFSAAHYLNVIPDNSVRAPQRLLVCSGKIGHILRMEREKRKDSSVAIIFIEQLYPWPEEEMQAALDQHPRASEIVWVQEEPANMGALTYVLPHLRRMSGDRAVLSVKRSANASPATGEEKTLIDLAFGA